MFFFHEFSLIPFGVESPYFLETPIWLPRVAKVSSTGLLFIFKVDTGETLVKLGAQPKRWGGRVSEKGKKKTRGFVGKKRRPFLHLYMFN